MTAIEWLTLALVLITLFYAWQTRQTVKEMRKARVEVVRPRIVPIVSYDAVGTGCVSVENIGTGPALDLKLVLAFEPGTAVYRIQLPLLAVGGRRVWNPGARGNENQEQPYHPDSHLPNHEYLHLTGSCRDLFGGMHQVDERVPVQGRWQARMLGQWFEGDTPVERAE